MRSSRLIHTGYIADVRDMALLKPALTSKQQEQRSSAFQELCRLVLTDAWGDRFLESFKALYSRLSPEQQAETNRHFSLFLNENHIREVELASQRLSVAFLVATKDCTKPIALTEKETAIMLKNVMPLCKQSQDVYSWQNAWLQLYETFADLQKEDALFSITGAYINQLYLDAITYKDSEGVAMFLLAMCKASNTEKIKPILKKIIDSGKMNEILSVLMQAVCQKSSMHQEEDGLDALVEAINSASALTAVFITILREKESIVLSAEEAAYLCHLYGRGNTIAQTVMSFNSLERFDAFQCELLRKALTYVRVTKVPESIDPQNSASIISYGFYFPRPRENEGVFEALPGSKHFSEERRKAIRILGFGVSELAAHKFLSELAYPVKKAAVDLVPSDSPEFTEMSVWDQSFKTASVDYVVPDPRIVVWLMVAALDEAQVDAYLDAAPLYLLTHFIWGAFKLRQPELMLKGLRCCGKTAPNCRNNINAMFDQLGLVVNDAQGSLNKDAERLPIINLLLAHCIREVQTPDIANLLVVFINTVRNEEVWHYLRPFYTVAAPPLSVDGLYVFKKSLCSLEMSEGQQKRLMARTAAVLIYSLHPEEWPSYFMRLLQSPYYFVEQVQQILMTFGFPAALGEAQDPREELRKFGMQEAVLQQLIALTDSSNQENLAFRAPPLSILPV